jgi:diguanylate cyclase (GGDEF)-like protein
MTDNLYNVLVHLLIDHVASGNDELFILFFTFSAVTAIYAFKKYIDLRKSNSSLLSSYTTDKLTDLGNREAFLLKLQKQTNINVVLLNIIDFQSVNKTFGYKEADNLLVDIANKLNIIVSKETGSKLYRIYGDEFAFICKKDNNIDLTCQNIKDSFEDKMLYFQDNFIHLSINISYSSVKPVLLTATIAMQECKNSLDTHIVSYDNFSYNSKKNKNSLEMLRVIKDAITHDSIIPVYHAIINNKTKKIHKYETLARIKQKNNELLSPFHFIELSKKFKLYPEITKSIIKKAFNDFKYKDVNFSINFSYIDIHNPKILKYFYNTLEENKQTAKRLTIEILETESIDSYEELLNFRKKIKKYGCKLAIDDFGAGYSNWINILKLKPDYIKLDGSLIEDLLLNKDNMSLVQTIVSFAKTNNIKTIAEYVSSAELAVLVKELGIDFSQGFHYARPEEIKNVI